MLSAARDLLLDELPAALPELSRRRGKALKKGQTQAAGSPALAPANSNEAGCQSGSIVGPAVLLHSTQDLQTKTSVKLPCTRK